MAAYLLVAHQTAESEALLGAARELHGQDPHARFAMLVPATPVDHLLVWEEGETQELARRAAEAAAARFRAHGLEVLEAMVGDPDPVHAVGDELRRGRHRYHAIVLSTLPAGVSRWLRMDAVSRVRRRYPKMRVVHVESPVPAATPRQS
jgi:hypothetical protein